jgi:hypothetical protein
MYSIQMVLNLSKLKGTLNKGLVYRWKLSSENLYTFIRPNQEQLRFIYIYYFHLILNWNLRTFIQRQSSYISTFTIFLNLGYCKF